jgi:hypothetical protein
MKAIAVWVLAAGVLATSGGELAVASQGGAYEHTDRMVPIYRLGNGEDDIHCMLMPELPDSDICATHQWMSTLYKDCSDAEFDCIFDDYNVMAVPRRTLVAGETYRAFGATLTVERCFDERECKIAMITSTCADAAVCSCRRADVGQTKVVFYSSAERGVTAFYSTAVSLADAAKIGLDEAMLEDSIPLRTFVLQADKGFLRMPVDMRPARLRTDCDD